MSATLLPLDLKQVNDGTSNGTMLWLGAQCLAVYLVDKKKHKVVELGSGIGFTAWVLDRVHYLSC